MSGYGQYCPIAKAAEVLGEKWTILILRELCINDQTFNNLRKGMPLLSPTLLSKRLKTLVAQEIIVRKKTDKGVLYSMTEAGVELKDMIMHLGEWGQRWVRSDFSKQDLDASLLIWDMHRTIDIDKFPDEKKVIQFEFLGAPPKERFYWLSVENREVEICVKNPGYHVDLSIRAALKEFTAFWMGDLTLNKLIQDKKLSAEGDKTLKSSMENWLCGNVFDEVKAASTK